MRTKHLTLLALVGLCTIAFAGPAASVLPGTLGMPPDVPVDPVMAVAPTVPGPVPEAGLRASNDFARGPGPGAEMDNKGEQDAIWGSEQQLTTGRSDMLMYNNADKMVVGYDGRIHIVWYYSSYVYYKRYNPGSASWSNDTLIYSASTASYPGIALDSNGTTVHLAYYNYASGYHIYYAKCDPTGNGNGGWGTAMDLCQNHSGTSIYHRTPSIACSPGRVHVAWDEYRSTSPAYRAVGYRENIGGTWENNILLDSVITSSWYHYNTAITAGRSHDVAIVWYGYGSGSTTYQHAWALRRVSGTWQSAEQIAGDITYYGYWPSPSISPTDNVLRVVWASYTNNYMYYVILLRERGATSWKVPETVSTGAYPLYYYQQYPHIVTDGLGRCHVSWYGYDNNYYYVAKYRERTAGGNWKPIDFVSPSGDYYYRYYTTVATDSGNNVHYLWDDTRTGYYSIFYRRANGPMQKDLENAQIVQPGGLVPAGQPIYPTVKIKNSGIAAQTGFDVGFYIDSSRVRVYTGSASYSGTLEPESSAVVQMTTPWYPAERTFISYTLKGFCDLAGDGYRANDTLTGTTVTCTFIEEFETSDGDWISTKGWEWGMPSGGGRPAPHSGAKYWGDKLSGTYASGKDSLILSNQVATENNPKIAFYSAYSLYYGQYYSGWRVSWSSNGGSSWNLAHATPGYGRGYDGIPYYTGESDSAYCPYGYGTWYPSTGWERMMYTIPVASGTTFSIAINFGIYYNYNGPGVMIDDVAGFGFRRPHDVGVTKINAPFGPIDSNVTVTPIAKIENFGRTPETFLTKMRIGDFYEQDVEWTLTSRDTHTLVFPDLLLLKRGVWAVTCSTMLAADDNFLNNKQVQSLDLRVRDVGCEMIVAPPDTVGKFLSYIPKALYTNYGTTTESFNCVFDIDDGRYHKTKPLTLDPGDDSLMFFIKDSVDEGLHPVAAYTLLSYDAAPYNDTMVKTLGAYRHDVGVSAIVAPTGEIPPSAPVAMTVTTTNFGGYNETFRTWVRIYNAYKDAEVYRDSLTVSVLAGEELTFDLPRQWTPATEGRYQIVGYTEMVGEQRRSNDTMKAYVDVVTPFIHDAAVMLILAPKAIVDTLELVQPKAKVKNFGEQADNFSVTFTIMDATDAIVYQNSIDVIALAPNATKDVTFPSWTGHRPVGSYTMSCSAYVIDDNDPLNNVLTTGLRVVAKRMEGWFIQASMPGGAGNKQVKDGGALTYGEEATDGAYIYGFKGNNTISFYQYNIATNTWAAKDSVPMTGASGKKKGVKKGGALAAIGGKVYARKGNATTDFFEYDPSSMPGVYKWSNKPGIPGAPSKDAGGLVGVAVGGKNYVYCLKGSATFEFLRYDIATGIWEVLPNAPAGLSGKPYKAGSCIGTDGAFVYVLKGTYNEYHAFDLTKGEWSTLPNLPFVGMSGSKKKAKDGAGLAYLGGVMYCLKGGNTRELWSYKAPGVWWQEPDMPQTQGKNVKGGGALAASPEMLWALKGNSTTDFFMYGPKLVLSPVERTPEANAAGKSPTSVSYLSIAPNPFSGTSRISYSLPQAGNVSMKLYDVTGTLVTTLAAGYSEAGAHTTTLDASTLARGIYVLKLESDNFATTSKLIIE